ncbi:transglycosylase SLT domain-containing protein [Candidatus Methylopumilus rimovensis]|uniref:transglycosylase SLT domain-containing protein n=1 Tax=Candidatus Methylopumilus rimovensis TaxID=2588535 RepID=UPI001123C3E5|nr:transglycosylase SLT domain-containing protein [Candidatus Methylopumilus rimovensis]QDD12137.1 LysM peptidoglycan-binding domain-containing protein [Candidatus Methylopumilus rimovensis]
MMLLTKHLLACICISISFMSSALAERNILGEEISILENDVIDQEINKLNTLNFNPTSSTNKSQNFQSIKAEINLWQRIYSRFDIKDENNSRSKKYEKWYSARPEYIERMMDRSQKYLFYVVGEVEKRGMPSEIALLPMIESAYNPIANSRSKAVGIWQFIPSTGRLYGLKQDWWQDKRRNVVDATNAALDYLQKLHALFGTWDLALAAYNAGEGTVSRAIAKNRAKGLPTDYANLKLPAETKDYVPKLQAIKNIVSNPSQYGLYIDPIPNKPYFTYVEAPAVIDADLAANLAEISYDEFLLLNSEHRRPLIRTNEKTQKFILPINAADTFVKNLSQNEKPLVSWNIYQPKRNEKIKTIANKFDMEESDLIKANDLNPQKLIKPSSIILVAKKEGTETNAHQDIDESKIQKDSKTEISVSPNKYKVKPGDTLTKIAKKYGISVNELKDINQITASDIQIGSTLQLKRNN